MKKPIGRAIKNSLIGHSKLYKIYQNWPRHFISAQSFTSKLDRDPSYYDMVVFSGMGGSGTVCDILNDLLERFGTIPSISLKGKIVPSFIGKRTLVIISSISGNTMECILSLNQAIKKNAEVICISSGGELKEISIKYGLRHIKIPEASHSRASFPYLLLPGLGLINEFLTRPMLDNIKFLSDELEGIYKKVSLDVPFESNIAMQMANFLNNSLVFCLTSPSLISVGTRFKNSLNENSKVHCISESILEASHNEIVPFTYESRKIYRKVLLLSWKHEIDAVNERFNKIRSLLKDLNHPIFEVNSPQQNILHSLVCSVYLLDITTIYLAALRKIDPSPTPAIDILKGANHRQI
jgi:glucose/mannose-6-phosphate isomerase